MTLTKQNILRYLANLAKSKKATPPSCQTLTDELLGYPLSCVEPRHYDRARRLLATLVRQERVRLVAGLEESRGYWIAREKAA